MKAASSGISLSEADAAIVKGMLARGDRQHDIAAWFGVNGGRIGEISADHTFTDVKIQEDGLPPPGPYNSGKVSFAQEKELKQIKSDLENILSRLDKL